MKIIIVTEDVRGDLVEPTEDITPIVRMEEAQ